MSCVIRNPDELIGRPCKPELSMKERQLMTKYCSGLCLPDLLQYSQVRLKGELLKTNGCASKSNSRRNDSCIIVEHEGTRCYGLLQKILFHSQASDECHPSSIFLLFNPLKVDMSTWSAPTEGLTVEHVIPFKSPK